MFLAYLLAQNLYLNLIRQSLNSIKIGKKVVRREMDKENARKSFTMEKYIGLITKREKRGFVK